MPPLASLHYFLHFPALFWIIFSVKRIFSRLSVLHALLRTSVFCHLVSFVTSFCLCVYLCVSVCSSSPLHTVAPSAPVAANHCLAYHIVIACRNADDQLRIELTMATARAPNERRPDRSHRQGSPHRRREPLCARKHRVSCDSILTGVTVTKQFHCDLQSLPCKSQVHCIDVVW